MKFEIEAMRLNRTTHMPQAVSGFKKRKFNSLEDAAKFVVEHSTNSVWFQLVDDLVDPPEEHDHVVAVIMFSAVADKRLPDHWRNTVRLCIRWFDEERSKWK